jgi:hypothetical protein
MIKCHRNPQRHNALDQPPISDLRLGGCGPATPPDHGQGQPTDGDQRQRRRHRDLLVGQNEREITGCLAPFVGGAHAPCPMPASVVHGAVQLRPTPGVGTRGVVDDRQVVGSGCVQREGRRSDGAATGGRAEALVSPPPRAAASSPSNLGQTDGKLCWISRSQGRKSNGAEQRPFVSLIRE